MSAPTSSGTDLDPAVSARLRRTPDGLVAAVVQQHDTGEVLMLGWMDERALALTLTTGRATYWSRSRQELWRKGDTSGHVQHVRSVSLDCDGDALLVRVDQVGPACHTGTRTCFDGRDLGARDVVTGSGHGPAGSGGSDGTGGPDGTGSSGEAGRGTAGADRGTTGSGA